MQESIKEAINIHKCKFFFSFYAGLRAGSRGSRAYAGLRAHYPSPPCVFSTGLRVGPMSQALIATPSVGLRAERSVELDYERGGS